eukprot:TRINITY_DN65729_c0_g1_i1.p1 TRINITY_DN65729_c0_g1~~TRINITY_DN65729_c0_g1_i1.p1  ORF type:complete len:146 (+),score=8.08 TRINITY_DN65729_c0_g1_i1:47-439(+)
MGYGGKGKDPFAWGVHLGSRMIEMMAMFKGKGKFMKGRGKGTSLQNIPNERKVWIGGLPVHSCSPDLDQRLKNHLTTVAGVYCIFAKCCKSGNAGAAFKTVEDMATAVAALNDTEFEGSTLRVEPWTKST